MRCIATRTRPRWPELTEMPAELGPAFLRAQRDLALPWTARTGRPKRTLFNFYFTRVSIDGMTGPFFLETLTNGTLLPYERAATVAHEWSHLAGYADESEANFVGWLVCMRGTCGCAVQRLALVIWNGRRCAAAIGSRRHGSAARRGPARRPPCHFRSHSAARGSRRQPRRLCALRSISESQ